MKQKWTLGAVALVAAFALPATAAAAADTAPEQVTTRVDGVTVTTTEPIETKAELNAFLLSNDPKTIDVQAATGKVVSVTEGIEPEMTTLATTVTNVCNTGNACLVASRVPYANFGFSGIGTKTGSWQNHIQWKTGQYTAKAWYSHNGTAVGWGATAGPNSVINMDKPVTAIQVTIYS